MGLLRANSELRTAQADIFDWQADLFDWYVTHKRYRLSDGKYVRLWGASCAVHAATYSLSLPFRFECKEVRQKSILAESQLRFGCRANGCPSPH